MNALAWQRFEVSRIERLQSTRARILWAIKVHAIEGDALAQLAAQRALHDMEARIAQEQRGNA